MSVHHFGPSARLGPRLPSSDHHAFVQDTLPWLVVLVGGPLLLVCTLLLGSPVGDALFRGTPLHVLPAYAPQVLPKPTQFGRFVIAVLFAFAAAAAILAAPRVRGLANKMWLQRVALPIVVLGQLLTVGIVAWAWRGQNEGLNHLPAVQFHLDGLLVAIPIAGALMVAAARGWLGPEVTKPTKRHRAAWATVAIVVTVVWLLPALFRSMNLAHSLEAVWYPLQFTFDDFMSVLDGRTPLVNYDTQYASLLPFVTEPFFKLFGASITTFTALMGILSLLAFTCVERSLAAVARSERTALLLYIPILAVSLFTLRHAGGERYYMANYYEVMPIRYVGPYLLFWCSVCHLRGSRLRHPLWLFTLAGLVAINNTEFGVPALGGCLLALASASLVPGTDSLRRLCRLGGEFVVGLVLATLAVSIFALLRTGSLPQLSRLTRYEQIYAITGFDLSPTPTAGLHIIIFMTLAATLVLAALRVRAAHPDRVLTGALAFSGTFGLGAGSYFMGRSLPEVLAALFSAWGLATSLLCLVAFQALRDPVNRPRIWPARALPVAGTLIMLGLFVTCVQEFPAPWKQVQRLMATSHKLQFNTVPAVRFVHANSHPGESVALLTSLGHIIGRDAGVIDVSPYSHPDGIVTYEQLDDVVSSLRAGDGDDVFTGAILPEISQFLETRGFRIIATDAPSTLTEWRDSRAANSSGA